MVGGLSREEAEAEMEKLMRAKRNAAAKSQTVCMYVCFFMVEGETDISCTNLILILLLTVK